MTDTMPRLLMILGSGETSPTMVTPHQRLFARLGAAGEVDAVLLDTPFGFQENADELTGRIQAYFRESVGREVGAARWRSRNDLESDPAGEARSLRDLESARWIFAGPGSPSYALATWYDTGVVPALDERLRAGGAGGALVFASAAALTLGAFTVPVYEIYKVGAEPVWLEGLDVLGRATGLNAAVIPHFDNSEGGTHDTRYCYLGQRRLDLLLEQLPDDAFVLGIDEHTGLMIDIDSGDCEVVGRGTVTVLTSAGRNEFRPGDALTLALIAELAGADGAGFDGGTDEDEESGDSDEVSPAQIREMIASGSVDEAVAEILALMAILDEDDTVGRQQVRSLIVELGDRAANAPVDRAAIVGPYLELLIELRAAARADKRFADSDLIRDRLAAVGVEIRDTPDGAVWEIA